MPRPKNLVPTYRLHQQSGQARVRIKVGERYRDFYLGEHGSQESLEKYQKLLGEHIDSESPPELETPPNVPGGDSGQWTIAELAMKYDEFASKF